MKTRGHYYAAALQRAGRGLPPAATRSDRSALLAAAPTQPTAPLNLPAEPPASGARPIILAGFAVIALFFGTVLGWAALSNLASAAIAPGVVSVDGSRKTVQHWEGGIVHQILVRDGDSVRAGQPLIELDDVKARAEFTALTAQHTLAAALAARLHAEYQNATAIIFPEDLQHNPEALAQQALADQNAIFQAKRALLHDQLATLDHRSAQQQAEQLGLQGKLGARRKQLNALAQQFAAYRDYAAKGLVTRSALFELEQKTAVLEAELSENQAASASLAQQLNESRARQAELLRQYTATAAQELRTARDQLLGLGERVAQAKDTLERTVIRAPIDGTVVNLRIHTPGGVVTSGQALLDLVPSGGRLLIDAKVDPKDRDTLRVGQSAEVRFSAFNQRSAVPVHGRVVTISADHLIEERTGQAYYLTRIELLDEPAQALNGQSIYPGMQAEVMIVTGSRTVLDYFFRPLTSSFNRALRED